ncbi:uncharacterized protein BX664DRAFT_334478 [Halteromyces radiatus]|uniref:uncharacterized protein n=1 Tax=Halteromyces radiatus TaxID=101107 RepID=UPI0022208242|nr:uncharacterized protein BX664DRAFT_334478 [Halteromyces radiatus]KAI8090009.1 hypothetical protein BX664DRAFT_334478 [Halteromyces radiatus]
MNRMSLTKKESLPPIVDESSILLLGRGQDINEAIDDKNEAVLLSPGIEVTGYELPDSMLVPFVVREEEIVQVIQRNPGFITQVQQQVDDHTFTRFKSTLFAPRHDINDHDWLLRIENLLSKLSTPIWENFQALVDHFPTSTSSTTDESDHQSSPKSPMPISTTPLSTPTLLSARPPLLAQLKEQRYDRGSSTSTATSGASSFRYLYDDHGYFFDPRIRKSKTWMTDFEPLLNECKTVMKSDDYRLFVHWLFVSPSHITDDHWESALYECLNQYPMLFLKLKDWIDQKIEE